MSFTPITGSALQYMQDSVSANDHYIKFYASGTTTPISMAIDNTGGTLLAKAQFNSQGYAINGSGAEFIPHIDQKYKIVFYPNATDADNNTFANAVFNIDLQEQFATISTVVENVKNHLTLAAMVADDTLNPLGGDATNLAERTTGNGGGAMWDSVLTSGVTPNTFNIVVSTAIPAISFVLRLGMVIHPDQWGAIDGADNTTVLEAINDILTSHSIVDLGSIEYVISKTGLPADPLGHRIFDLTGKNGVTIKADRARVTVTNHDIATNKGITFIFGKAANGLYVRGIDFDMSFVGINTSASFYPQCSAIRGDDLSNSAAGGVRTQAQLNGNWWVDNCTFKMFHTSGSFAQSGAAFGGDPNNGFKIFPMTVLGPFDATIYANQPRKMLITNCTLKDGHNGYGFWGWAWNDVTMAECTAESWVGKQSNSSGVYSGTGEPMMRYHQFHCQGFNVINNHFRAKPCSERTTTGFEGDSRFVDYNTNLLGNFGLGGCTITGNTIISGRGDLANTAQDIYINLFAYGSISVGNNTFESTSETTNALTGVGISWNGEAKGGQGNATLSIGGNTFNAECDWLDNISISNGGSTVANRRLKSLVIDGNATIGQAQYFVKMANSSTSYGVQDLTISNNTISGEFNTQFDKDSTNSRAIEVSGSEATDICKITENIIRDKYYAFQPNDHAGSFIESDNQVIGDTSRYLGANPSIQVLTGAGAVSLSTATHIVTTGTDALTLVDGVEGQKKFIVMKTDGGTGTLTPASMGNGSTVTFDDLGDSAELYFTNSAWYFMGGSATLA